MDVTALFTPFLAPAEISISFNQATKISINVWRPDEDAQTDHIIEFHLDPLNLAETVKSSGHVTKLTNESKTEYIIHLTHKDVIIIRETMRA